MTVEIDFRTEGFEDFEISTQIVVKEAIKRGVKVEVLNREANFLRLSKDGRSELVQQATKTSLDSLVTYLALENKAVTKLLLEEKGLPVPRGTQVFSVEEALEKRSVFLGKPLVMKPSTTNMGIGISFLSKGWKEEEFLRKVKDTFQFDSSIIIEEFIKGKEYRFLVIDHKLVGVCERVPANVLGDGVSSIRELVKIKNQDPRRGQGHKTPLERIDLGKVEKDILSSQGLTPDSVPESEEQVFLRHNSNISTGGDSVDRSDETHESYKELAVEASRVLGSRLTGIDIMIENLSSPRQLGGGGCAIIELNFNPVLFIHQFPYQGDSRDVGARVLDALSF